MGISPFFAKKEDQTSRFFLALLISDSTVQAGFWEVGDQSVIVNERSVVRSYSDVESMLVETDKALQELGKESEDVEEVILGLEFNWVAEKGIADVKKPLLKKLTSELQLKPVGFVVATEALFHYLLADDPQLSTLLIQYATDHITVSIINRGKLTNTERVGRSENPGADIQEATARLLASDEQDVLPPRIHLISNVVKVQELKDLKDELNAFDWKQVNPKINHQPIVEILSPDTLLTAVIQEGGKAVAQSMGFSVDGTLEKSMTSATQLEKKMPVEGTAELDEADADEDDDTEEQPQQSTQKNEALFGDNFTVPTKEELDGKKVDNEQEQSSQAAAGGIVSKVRSMLPFMGGGNQQSTSSTSSNPTSSSRTRQQGGSSNAAIDWAKHHLYFVGAGFAAGLFTLIVIAYLSLLSAKQAVVTLTLDARTIAEDAQITLDPSIDQSDPEELLLKASQVEENFSATKTIDTTGVSLVGESATGRIELSNKTEEERTISAGTQVSAGDVSFTLDEEVRIASASVSTDDDGETKTFGKAEVSVTATAIGADSNIDADTTLSVSGFSDSEVTAQAVETFTGGSSREVRVFSREDQEVLLEELTKELLEQAEVAFKEGSDAGSFTLPTGEIEIISEDYDAEVGDEVSSVNLSLEATVFAVSYLKEDVLSLAEVVLEDQIPDGYQLSDKEPNILSQPAEDAETTSSSEVVLDVNISAQALPKYDEASFKREIAGQSPDSAAAILRGKGEVEEATVMITPRAALWFSGSLPRKEEAISFEVEN